MSEKYPVAIWGVGPAGGNYLRAMCQGLAFDVVGLINRNEERRNAASKQTGVPGFADLQDLLKSGVTKPKMLVIATANPTHKAFTIEALESRHARFPR